MAGSLESTLEDRRRQGALDHEIDRGAPDRPEAPSRARCGSSGACARSATSSPSRRWVGTTTISSLTRGGETAVAIGDVSGHGLPTALLVATAKAALSALLESGEEGSALFAKMNALALPIDRHAQLHDARLRRPGQRLRDRADQRGAPSTVPDLGRTRGSPRAPARPLRLFEEREFPTRSFPWVSGTGSSSTPTGSSNAATRTTTPSGTSVSSAS